MDNNQLPKRPLYENPLLYMVLIGLLVLVALGATWYLKKQAKPMAPPPSTTKDIESQLYAQVGSEFLYRKDFDDLKFRTNKATPNIDQVVKDQLVKDSVTLQAGAKANLVTLDDSIFNSLNKDDSKRATAVATVAAQIASQKASLEGEMVTVWFLNNRVGPLGLEKSRQIAQAKINDIYNQVKNQQISMKQAGDLIASDSALAQVDPAYKINAYRIFSIDQTGKVSEDQIFNQSLWQLNDGDLSPITTLQSADYDHGGQMVDAYFGFVKINKRTNSGIVNYDNWVTTQERNYEVKFF